MCRKVTIKQYLHAAGQIVRLSGNKQGRQSVIVDRIGYDKEGHTVYTKLGNGTETTYTYDKQRERLQVMNLTADGQTVMENKYRYDAITMSSLFLLKDKSQLHTVFYLAVISVILFSPLIF